MLPMILYAESNVENYVIMSSYIGCKVHQFIHVSLNDTTYEKNPKLFFHINIEIMSSIVVVDNPLFAFYDGSIFAIDKMLL